MKGGGILKNNKNCWNINKYFIALLLIIFSPVLAPFLYGGLSDISVVAGKSLLKSLQPHSDLKTQTIFLSSILNEEFIPVIVEESLVEKEKGNRVPFIWKFANLNIREYVFFAVSIAMLHLFYFMSFMGCPPILISYIHKKDGKKDREYLFAN